MFINIDRPWNYHKHQIQDQHVALSYPNQEEYCRRVPLHPLHHNDQQEPFLPQEV